MEVGNGPPFRGQILGGIESFEARPSVRCGLTLSTLVFTQTPVRFWGSVFVPGTARVAGQIVAGRVALEVATTRPAIN